MQVHFWKMHGIGNDYIYFDCMKQELSEPEEVARRLSDRHYSVGGDGIILIGSSTVADAKMRIFNADGSEGKMCGNGIRCVGKFLYEVKEIKKDVLTVETLSGIKTLYITAQDGIVQWVTVDMGKAILDPERIPARFAGDRAVNEPMLVGDDMYSVTCVSMGNPHCVVFVPDIHELDLERIGPLFETHENFPERINTEFVKVMNSREIAMRVWERGSGETWACGTGACAAVVACVLNGECKKGEEILVHLRGGNLTITYRDDTVLMKGTATLAFTGSVEI